MSKLEHIATIDYCYWRLEKLNEALSKPKSTMEQLVDKACVFTLSGTAIPDITGANASLSFRIVRGLENTLYPSALYGYYFLCIAARYIRVSRSP